MRHAIPGGQPTAQPELSLRVARAAVFMALFGIAIAACTGSEKKQSGTAPGAARETAAPSELPPSGSTAPPSGAKPMDAAAPAAARTGTAASVSGQDATVQATGPTTGAKPSSDQTQPDTGWPRTLWAGGMAFTIYQPQLDSWDGFILEAHAAVALESGGEQPPAFGVVGMSARTLVNKEERLVALEDLKIKDARFASAPEQAQAYGQVLSETLPRSIKSVSLDRLEVQLAIRNARIKSKAVPLENTPPRIVFMQHPSLLVYIDGEPRFVPVEGTNLSRVVNTRVLLLKDPAGRVYLHLLDGYMQALALSGPWSVAQAPPADASKAEAAARESRQIDLLDGPEDPKTKEKPSLGPELAPNIIVATAPAELIVTEGEPTYVPIHGTSLLYVKNTTADVFKRVTDQLSYVLLGGRWFRAKSFDGPWEFVPAKSLPKDFSRIPDSSRKENVKASVPGTRQAQEALIADRIPTTARVERKAATFTPQIDGEPKLAVIGGTPLQYVLNTPAPIIRVDDTSWYACQDGVWFSAGSMTGPWQAAVMVPAVIYTIPPSSPVHYVTYVRVYRVTPTYVYVGYTPGYYGAVVAPGGVVVYGTGYSYPPWIGRHWIGYPVTYGMGAAMAWTPWTSWAFGFGFGWPYGPAWWRPPAPWWGPYYTWGYNARGGMAAWGPGGWASATGNIYAHRAGFSTVQREAAAYNAFTANQWATRYGTAYNSTTGKLITGQNRAVKNVYTGNYAYGARGVATTTRTGAAASGGKLTVGDASTGNAAMARRIAVDKPGEPPRSAVGIRAERESLIAVGGLGDQQVFGTRDGNVYRRGDNGQWEQIAPLSGPGKPTLHAPSIEAAMPPQYTGASAQRSAPLQVPGGAGSQLTASSAQSLDRERQAQDLGNLRAASFQSSRPPGGFSGGKPGTPATPR